MDIEEVWEAIEASRERCDALRAELAQLEWEHAHGPSVTEGSAVNGESM